MRSSNSIRILWLLILLALVLPGIVLLLLAILPYSSLKPVADALAKDGSMQSFTLPVYQSLRWATGPLGFILLAIAIFSLSARLTTQRWLENLLGWLKQRTLSLVLCSRQLIVYFTHVERHRRYLLGLMAITVLGAWSRLMFLSLPIRYDEAYTFIAFAMHPLKFIISNYHLPNNHVFHTILVYFTYHLFGDQLWSIRLPALLAGILIIPATYLVARLFYDRNTALFSAGLAAASSELIDFSTNARGYTLICLFWLFLLALAYYLKDHRNWVGWGLFILLAALGFYTIPIMLYPFGAVMLWLLLSWLVKDIGLEYGRSFILYWMGAGVVAGVLTILLYTPILYESGVDEMLGNRFVSPIGWTGLLESNLGRFRNTWNSWNRDLPAPGSLLFLAGVILSQIFHWRLSKTRLPLSLPIILWCGFALAVQQVAPWPRIWLFLLPVFFIWAAAGLVGLISQIPFPRIAAVDRAGSWAAIAGALVVAGLVTFNVVQLKTPNISKETGAYGDTLPAAKFLKSYLEPGDAVIVTLPSNYPLKYYFVLNDIPTDYFYHRKTDASFQRAIVVVNRLFGQNLAGVIHQASMQETLNPAAGKLIQEYKGVVLYEFHR
ncbi:MAG: glycosyltransferase family 39 protein [Anaerolineales bacterium]|jgi:4-amino-4-deoxy-L-arabinose transferase-like glycosyltransferase